MKQLFTLLITAFAFTAQAQLTNKAWSNESLNNVKQNIAADLGTSFILVDSTLVLTSHASPKFTFKAADETVNITINKNGVKQTISEVFVRAKLKTALNLYQSLYGVQLNESEILKAGHAETLQKDKTTIALYRDSRNREYWQIAERSN